MSDEQRRRRTLVITLTVAIDTDDEDDFLSPLVAEAIEAHIATPGFREGTLTTPKALRYPVGNLTAKVRHEWSNEYTTLPRRQEP